MNSWHSAPDAEVPIPKTGQLESIVTADKVLTGGGGSYRMAFSEVGADVRIAMRYNEDKVADTVLALFALTMHDECEYGARAWKQFDWSILDMLHERGLIADPKNKNKSVSLTRDGVQQSRKLFRELFCDET